MIKIDSFIEIYAADSVENIEKNGAIFTDKFQLTEQELTSDSQYMILKEQVKSIKLELENAIKPNLSIDQNDEHDEVRKCLRLIKDICLFEKSDQQKIGKLNILHGLINKGVYNSWSQMGKGHFDKMFNKLRDNNMFFVSYTNEGSNILNENYKSLIEKLIKKLDGTPLAPSDYKENNLVAEKSVIDFTKRGVPVGKIFYDKRSIKTSDHLEKEILPNCKKSFAFIQILHEDTFTEDWPYKEFDQYSQVANPIFCFLLCADDLSLIIPEFHPEAYKKWFRKIDETRYEKIENNYDNFKAVIRKVSQAINEKINRQLYSVA